MVKARSFAPATREQKFYLAFTIVGLVVPYALLTAFIERNGFNVRLFVEELFGNYAATMAMADLLLSSIVFWFWLFSAERASRLRYRWMYVLANVTVGLCFALPLFLYVRSVAVSPEPAVD